MTERRELEHMDAANQSAGQDQPSDSELLRQHVEGDAEAFGKLFRRHSGRLWAVALRTVGDPEDAADALQDAMISAFRRAGDFRGEAAVTTWLHRIVVNAAVDRLRRRSGRTVSWSAEADAIEALAPHDPADAVETRLDVDAALRVLPPQQRAALVLVDMLGYSVADAAEILDVSPGTVKSRCARGRARLLPYLSHLRTNLPRTGNQPPPEDVSSGQEGGS
jgi:RNA polymerase sigma-70 factor (ECF subfamily)